MKKKIWRLVEYWLRMILNPKNIVVNGIKINVENDAINEDMKKILYTGGYEFAESNILPKVLKKTDVVMEIGSGIGYLSSLSYKVINKPNRIFTYEANPMLESAIQETFQLNNVDVKAFNVILSNQNGETDFYVSDKFYSSSLVNFDKKAKKIKVKTIDVNDEISRLKPTFLICDIEGFEIEFFKYINDYSTITAILLEIHPSKVENEKINDLINSLYTKCFFVDYNLSDKHVLFLSKNIR